MIRIKYELNEAMLEQYDEENFGIKTEKKKENWEIEEKKWIAAKKRKWNEKKGSQRTINNWQIS